MSPSPSQTPHRASPKPGVLTTRELIRLGARGVLVTDDEIERASAFLWHRCGMNAEGGGAAAVAALLAGKVAPASVTVAIVSGGNIDSYKFNNIVDKHDAVLPPVDRTGGSTCEHVLAG
jgi:threonine dehydratase